jgi:serine protease Do
MRYATVLLLATCLALPATGTADVAQELEQTFISVAEKVSDSVVYLEVKSRFHDPRTDSGSPLLDEVPEGYDPLVEGSGSGVIIDPDGLILTNHHVIRGAVDIQVRLHDNRVFPAEIVGEDPDGDLAVVRIDASGLQAATFAEMTDVHVGQWAIAIGAPFGLRYSITVGHVSARARRDIGELTSREFLQTDASINPGNSGGPLVDIEGRVIGINTMIIGMGTGIGLAIPSDVARDVSAVLVTEGRLIRGEPGLTLQDGEPDLIERLGAPADTAGVVVAEVEPGGPADAAGITRGDVIVRLDGEPVAVAGELLEAFLATRPGTEVALQWYHEGGLEKGALTLDERYEGPAVGTSGPIEHTGDDIGITVEGLTEEINVRLGRAPDAPGLLVIRVRVGSPAHRAEIEFGDLVLEVENLPMRYPIDLAKAVLRSDGDQVVMYVERPAEGAKRYILVDKP